MPKFTYYQSRCPGCGSKGRYIVENSEEIRCPNCGSLIGIKINSNLEVTILCSWNDSLRVPKKRKMDNA
jgi:DNA-directed RNA polymerase subunit RPC12/RpoP